MSVIAIEPESGEALWREAIGCLLGKRAFPLDCRVPTEWIDLLKGLG